MMSGPLVGIKVLDITSYWNGPASTRQLADYGAEVIKVEIPGVGDFFRGPVGKRPDGKAFTVVFEAANRGKKSLELDLRKPKSRIVMERLVRWADVVVDNFRSPEIMEKWGFGYEQMKEWNNRIIYGQNSSFGPRGPKAGHGSFDAVAQAFTGAAVQNGGGPSHKPLTAPWILADEVGALNFTIGILMALINTSKTGEGQKLLTSQTGAMVNFQAYHLIQYTGNRKIYDEGLEHRQEHPVQMMFKCSDEKWIIASVVLEKQWGKLCKNVILRPELVEDSRSSSAAARLENKDWLRSILEPIFAKRDRLYWLAAFQKSEIPGGAVNSYIDIEHEPQLWANGYLEKVKHPTKGSLTTIGKPLNFSASPASPATYAPDLGEHNFEILSNLLEFTEREISDLVLSGVVGKISNSKM